MGDAEDDPSVVREEKAAREAVEKAATNTPLFARYRVPRAATASSAIATGGIRIVASDAMIAGPCLVSARWLVLLRSMWKMQRANEPRLNEVVEVDDDAGVFNVKKYIPPDHTCRN